MTKVGADIQRLMNLAYPQAYKELIDQFVVQTFIDGVRDLEMPRSLRLVRHTSINAVLIASLECEGTKSISRSINSKFKKVMIHLDTKHWKKSNKKWQS